MDLLILALGPSLPFSCQRLGLQLLSLFPKTATISVRPLSRAGTSTHERGDEIMRVKVVSYTTIVIASDAYHLMPHSLSKKHKYINENFLLKGKTSNVF